MKKLNFKNKIRPILLGVLWTLLGAGCVSLLVAAASRRSERVCKGVEIRITGVSNNFFIDRKDVRKIIESYVGKEFEGKSVSAFNLSAMEVALEKDVWIRNAEMYFDNNDVLQADVEEREPVARVFGTSGNSFYLDSAARKLPLSDKLSARVPVFTGYPDSGRRSVRKDSLLLRDIRNLSMTIAADPFLMALVEQADVVSGNRFELIPKVGQQVIVFGDAGQAEKKFEKLKLFYRKIMPGAGWSKYSSINLQYRDQVVAKRRGADDVSADSLRTIRMMEWIAAQAERMAEDSLKNPIPENDRRSNTDLSMIQQAFQREEATVVALPPFEAPRAEPVEPKKSGAENGKKKQEKIKKKIK